MRIFVPAVYTGLFLFLISCQNEPGKKHLPLKAAGLYGTFVFTYDESSDQADGLFQFSRGENKKGVFLPKGASIRLDGKEIQGDSVSIGEVYYEPQMSLDDFVGKHLLQLNTENGKDITEPFILAPVTLIDNIPGKIKRENLVLSFNGLEENDRVQASFIDTAFSTNDLHVDTSLEQNTLLLRKERFLELSKGPLMIQISIERRMILNKLNGNILVRYLFRKEVELED